VPQTRGEIIRVALEGIAMKYRWVLGRLEELIGRSLEPIHIIGGGTKNRLLNQFTADVTCRTVVTGPVEATAIGNVLMQAVGLGHLDSLQMHARLCALPLRWKPMNRNKLQIGMKPMLVCRKRLSNVTRTLS
jgi:sugar (pentulose or hexulose) kinase